MQGLTGDAIDMQGTLVLRRIPRGDAATWNLREVKAAIANTSSGMILSAAGGRGITEWSEDGRLQVGIFPLGGFILA